LRKVKAEDLRGVTADAEGGRLSSGGCTRPVSWAEAPWEEGLMFQSIYAESYADV
jgi:hypothetical protein